MARILIYQPLSYLEDYVPFDLSWLFLFDHVIHLFSPIEAALSDDDYFKASRSLKQAGLFSDSADHLSPQEMDSLYSVPKGSMPGKEEFCFATPSRRLKKILDAKHPKDSHSIYFASNGQFESDYTEGMTPLLKIAIGKFPMVDVHFLNIGEFIDFLRESKTLEKKRAFCAVLDDIESWILNGEIQIHDVPDFIASRYEDYLRRIGLLKRNYVEKSAELVMTFSETILSRLAFAKLSPAAKHFIGMIRKGAAVSTNEKNVPNRELAYIEHINGHFKKEPKPRLLYAL